MMRRFSIDDLERSGYFLEIDLHFARFITRSSNRSDPNVFLAAALISSACGKGDVCLDIAALAGRLLPGLETAKNAVRCPELDPWMESLRSHTAVGGPGETVPIILDDRGRLYLHRYWEYEHRLAADIQRRARADMPGVDLDRLQQGVRRLFPPALSAKTGTDWQKVAAVVSVLKRLCIITGGPGTGKTYTVAKILALLLEQGISRIALAAPTGKAAARMAESIAAAKTTMDGPADILQAIPSATSTIHRLLKPIPDSPYFRHHADHLLPVDVLVVDEASMVDLALMSKLVQAVPFDTRLIIIGDKDQLSSVEAGSVFGDLCNRATRNRYGAGFRKQIESITDGPVDASESADLTRNELQQGIVILGKSHRFSENSGIGAFSRAVNRGDPDAAMACLNQSADRSVLWRPISTRNRLFQFLSPVILNGYRRIFRQSDINETIAQLDRHKILCALKKGPFGADSINRFAESELRKHGSLQPGSLPWYAGRPILITQNDYFLSLFNGDIGITLQDNSGASAEPLVYFRDPTGDIRGIPPYRLPEHETVYAMTVHKSQGSEFDHVTLVLPDQDAPVLTRELIYTAVTRARKTLTIYGREAVIRSAITKKIDRTSGLRDVLWND